MKDELYFEPTIGQTAQDTMNMIIALDDMANARAKEDSTNKANIMKMLNMPRPGTTGPGGIIPREPRENPLVMLMNLIGDMQNPLAGILNPRREGETLKQTWDEYKTGEPRPSLKMERELGLNALRNVNQQNEVDSILQNYVKGLINEKRIPGQFQR